MSTEEKEEQLAKAEELYKKAFEGPREPRSDAYKLGVMAVLIYRVAGININKNCPYKIGTAEHDAFLYGGDEGNSIWKAQQARKSSARPEY